MTSGGWIARARPTDRWNRKKTQPSKRQPWPEPLPTQHVVQKSGCLMTMASRDKSGSDPRRRVVVPPTIKVRCASCTQRGRLGRSFGNPSVSRTQGFVSRLRQKCNEIIYIKVFSLQAPTEPKEQILNERVRGRVRRRRLRSRTNEISSTRAAWARCDEGKATQCHLSCGGLAEHR